MRVLIQRLERLELDAAKTNHLEKSTLRAGLHCVWARAGEGASATLVARWIDTRAEASAV
jgi:hypothetical protein